MYICITKVKGTQKVPYFIAQNLENMKDYLESLLEEVLEERSYFIVSIDISDAKKKIEIYLDDEHENIPISELAKMSRWMLNRFEEDQHKADEYVLEMSSPGIGTPLTDIRQYRKNVDRHLEIKHDDKVSTGRLVEFSEELLVLEAERPKKSNKKQMEKFELNIPFNSIIESKVVVKF